MDNNLFLKIFRYHLIRNEILKYIKIITKQLELKSYSWLELQLDCVQLIKYNYIDSIKVLFKEYDNSNSDDRFFYNSRITFSLRTALRFGRVEILEYFIDHLKIKLNDYLQLNEIMHFSSLSGKIELLLLLDKLDYLSGKDEYSSFDFEVDHYVGFNLSPLNGYIETVQWFSNRIGNTHTDPRLLALCSAAKLGKIDIIHWLLENRPLDSRGKLVQKLLNKGYIHLVESLLNSKHIDKSNIIVDYDILASKNQLESIKWCHNLKHASNNNNNDDKEIVIKCTSLAMNIAATRVSNLEMVEWLHFNRTEGCTTMAIDEGVSDLNIIKFLLYNRSEGCTRHAMDNAAKIKGNLEIVQFLHYNRTEGCSYRAIENATKQSDFAMVKWLAENRTERYEYFPTLTIAAKYGSMQIYQYFEDEVFKDNRLEDIQQRFGMACFSGNLDVISYLYEKYYPTSIDWATKSFEACASYTIGYFDSFKLLYKLAQNELAKTNSFYNSFINAIHCHLWDTCKFISHLVDFQNVSPITIASLCASGNEEWINLELIKMDSVSTSDKYIKAIKDGHDYHQKINYICCCKSIFEKIRKLNKQ